MKSFHLNDFIQHARSKSCPARHAFDARGGRYVRLGFGFLSCEPANITSCYELVLKHTKILIRMTFCSLAHLPGPWYTKCTNLVLKYHVLTGNRVHYVHRLHNRYGPIVRIAPSEADVSDHQSFKEIHHISKGFLKSSWYQTFRGQPVRDLFTIQDPKAYAARRKLMARPLSKSSLRESWEIVVRDS